MKWTFPVGERKALIPPNLNKSKEWYLKAFCLEKQDFRMFKLNRILHLDVLDQTFVPKLYPEAEPDYGQTCPKIALLFSKEIAYRIYDEFASGQRGLSRLGPAAR